MKLDIDTIKSLIPHRTPMLLVEHVDDIEKFKYAQFSRRYKKNDHIFKGHFPDNPVFPGIFIIETLAQLAAVFGCYSVGEPHRQTYLMSIDDVKFRKPIYPETDVKFYIELIRRRDTIWKFKGMVYCGGDIVHESKFLAMLGK